MSNMSTVEHFRAEARVLVVGSKGRRHAGLDLGGGVQNVASEVTTSEAAEDCHTMCTKRRGLLGGGIPGC